MKNYASFFLCISSRNNSVTAKDSNAQNSPQRVPGTDFAVRLNSFGWPYLFSFLVASSVARKALYAQSGSVLIPLLHAPNVYRSSHHNAKGRITSFPKLSFVHAVSLGSIWDRSAPCFAALFHESYVKYPQLYPTLLLKKVEFTPTPSI
jgi:hypothetical protein